MQKYSDLRFIIGLFFTMSGLLVFVLGLMGDSNKEFGKELNLYSGGAMLAFGLFMLWLNLKAKERS